MVFPFFCINTTMRAKEFIIEYAIVTKPDFTQVSDPCVDCNGTGNVENDGSNQTCLTCKGVGTNDSTLKIQAGDMSDTDHHHSASMKNRPTNDGKLL